LTDYQFYRFIYLVLLHHQNHLYSDKKGKQSAGKENLSLSLESWRLYLFAIIARLDFISWEDRHVCLVSKGERIILIDGYFRDAGSTRGRVCGSFFLSLFLSCTSRSFSDRDGKTKRGKKDEGETLFVPRQNADKSVWSPRRGRRLWKFRETGMSANGRETKRRTPSKAPTLSARLWHSSSALFARGVAYDGGCHRVSELALRSLACSRHLLFPGLFPGSLQRDSPLFLPAIVWSTLFINTPRVLGQCPT